MNFVLSSDDEPFASFWMGGFEGADHVNADRVALDMNRATGHAAEIEADHRRAAEAGIGVVRESIGWRLAEAQAGCFDFNRMLRTARSADRHGLQVVWSLMHYGTPPDVSLFDDSFVDRFVAFAAAVAVACKNDRARPPIYNLINEIGFVSWIVSETNEIHPYRGDPGEHGVSSESSGYEVKRRLVRATLAAIDAVRRIDPRARFLHVEPLVHVVAPRGRPDLVPLAERVNGYQWQVWDMLAGRCDATLGGTPAALDLVGINHYHSSQWEVLTEERLDWHPQDARRMPLARLLRTAWQRYGRPLVLAETSHFGDGRAAWLHEIAAEVRSARREGTPIHGICLYPLIDRHDWADVGHWHHSGLWDVDLAASPMRRVPCIDYVAALRAWQSCIPENTNSLQEGEEMTCLLVLSHLRWDFVYQRPQHLMSRLARHYRVIYVEEPVRSAGETRLERKPKGPNIEVLVPHTPVDAAGFHDDQLSLLNPMLLDFLAEEGIEDCVAWLYTPMALPLLAQLAPRAVVYDCMDELAAFRFAPRQLHQRETALLKLADLVFTGGPALYEAKRDFNPNVICLPSSVDAAHFAPDRLDPASARAEDARRLQGALPAPRLGFFGVIDERFDTELIGRLADSHPEWSLVMVGPVVKIDPHTLPRRANIHWLGSQPYEGLPHLLAGWDVCLLPFAIDESTRYISPTKTLEYMAGRKPIVSTAVRDVSVLYASAVRIGVDHSSFIAACEAALAETDAERELLLARMDETVSRLSWDKSAASVAERLQQVLRAAPLMTPMAPAAAPVLPVIVAEPLGATGTDDALAMQPTTRPRSAAAPLQPVTSPRTGARVT